jgi:hypothetical protein
MEKHEYGSDMNEKINKIKEINDTESLYRIIEAEIRGKSREQKLKILKDWNEATKYVKKVDKNIENTAGEVSDLIDGLMMTDASSSPIRQPSPPRLRRRRSPNRSRTAASPTSHRLRRDVENNPSPSGSRSRSPARHRSRGGKGHKSRKHKTRRHKRSKHKRSKHKHRI